MDNPHALARTTDPDTSHAAARKAATKCAALRAEILEVLEEQGDLTHDELILEINARAFAAGEPPSSPSSVRTRCKELVTAGRVRAVTVSVSRMNNRAKTWGLIL